MRAVQRLTAAELVGMAGSVVLVVGLFLPWYHLETFRNVVHGHKGPATLNAWESFGPLCWVAIAAATAPFVLAYIVARDRSLSWARGEMTAVTSMVVIVFIVYVLLIAKPGSVRALTSLEWGGFVSLVGSLLMAGASAYRASTRERGRKPPGVL